MSREGIGIYLVHNQNVICLEYKVRGRAVTGCGNIILTLCRVLFKVTEGVWTIVL